MTRCYARLYACKQADEAREMHIKGTSPMSDAAVNFVDSLCVSNAHLNSLG
jgi:hypothetical protein